MKVEVELIWTVCGNCGVTYAIPKVMQDAKYRSGGTWHCPNGHKWEAGETECDRLKREVAGLNDRIDTNRKWKNVQLEDKRHTIAGLRGQITKLKKKLEARDDS